MNEILPETEKLYEIGANFTADAVIIRDNKLCLIKRSDGGGWALPGGFRNKNEHSLASASREANEETGLSVSGGQLVYSGRVDDPRNSETRWIDSDAYLFTASSGEIVAQDDAADVSWFDFSVIPDQLYGSHATMIENARRFLALESLLDHAEEVETRGGHMAYEYGLHKIDNNHLFTKQFSPSNFSHPEKELHSLFYLKKEANILDHLQNQGFLQIPRHHELVADSTLVLEGLSETKGWLWHCPTDVSLQNAYIHDVLLALSQLETTMPLELQEPIRPPLVSFYEEGWGSYSQDSLQDITTKIREFTPRLHFDADYIEHMIATLPNLAAYAGSIKPGTHYSHHDIRQSNIAWHPECGTKIIDWSWYGPGAINADATSFLIDCRKSGIDVIPYLKQNFNQDYALLLIGFWLHHSLWPLRTEDDSVRLHQVASALTAFELVETLSSELSSPY